MPASLLSHFVNWQPSRPLDDIAPSTPVHEQPSPTSILLLPPDHVVKHNGIQIPSEALSSFYNPPLAPHPTGYDPIWTDRRPPPTTADMLHSIGLEAQAPDSPAIVPGASARFTNTPNNPITDESCPLCRSPTLDRIAIPALCTQPINIPDLIVTLHVDEDDKQDDALDDDGDDAEKDNHNLHDQADDKNDDDPDDDNDHDDDDDHNGDTNQDNDADENDHNVDDDQDNDNDGTDQHERHSGHDDDSNDSYRCLCEYDDHDHSNDHANNADDDDVHYIINDTANIGVVIVDGADSNNIASPVAAVNDEVAISHEHSNVNNIDANVDDGDAEVGTIVNNADNDVTPTASNNGHDVAIQVTDADIDINIEGHVQVYGIIDEATDDNFQIERATKDGVNNGAANHIDIIHNAEAKNDGTPRNLTKTAVRVYPKLAKDTLEPGACFADDVVSLLASVTKRSTHTCKHAAT